ncbi:MAG TPA: type I methionyl aminopeptidase [Chitinophagaceae bacterium]|jgi:methionyl aminopeptidase|nr:type I methionyl aminopeptidase [Chitinophagaceae bacterium]
MIHLKNEQEIELMRISAQLVSGTIAEVARILKPGMTTLAIDKLIHTIISDHGAVPSFLNFHGYPFSSCISVNDVVVHGFPNERPLQEGDLVSIDVGVFKNGFHGDHAYTFLLGEPAEEVKELVRTTKESLYKGIEKAVAGNRIGDVSYAIQEHTEKKKGYGVVRELVGHGLGRNMHEDPQVPNYGRRGTGAKLKEGLVLAIEPMINLGTEKVFTEPDGWTVRTKDGKPSVHFEHDVAIRKGAADVLSDYAPIEEAERANPNLFAE